MNEPAVAIVRITIGGRRITPQSPPLELAFRAPSALGARQRKGHRLG